MKKQTKAWTGGAVRHVLLSLLTIVQLFPLIITLLNSFRSKGDIMMMPIAFPKEFLWKTYADTWEHGGYLVAYGNSIFVGLVVIALVVFVTGLAAYGLAKMNIYGKPFFLVYLMSTISIPTFAYMVPDYFLFAKLGMVNNLGSVILIYSAVCVPFNALLMRSYFVGIPKELEEAAKVDGCSELQSLLHITVPLARPIITTVSLMVLLYTWNDFLWANLLLTRDISKTVTIRFFKFCGEFSSDMSKISASAIIAMGPIVLIYLLTQKSFAAGITQGGVKG